LNPRDNLGALRERLVAVRDQPLDGDLGQVRATLQHGPHECVLRSVLGAKGRGMSLAVKLRAIADHRHSICVLYALPFDVN
jgi:hypothetical protein